MKQRIFGLIGLLLLLLGCNSTKFVPEGQYLLNKVAIKTDQKELASKDELESFLRQTPNTEILGFWKLQLGVYNRSGKDTTKWINRAFRKMGDAPIIYNHEQTEASLLQLQQAIRNKGYFNATVSSELETKKKKSKVSYHIKSGEPYLLNKYQINIAHDTLYGIISDKENSYIKPNMNFDISTLDAERVRIAKAMKNEGYYYFEKDFLHYTADSTKNQKRINLNIGYKKNLLKDNDTLLQFILKKYKIRMVVFHTNYNPTADASEVKIDTVRYGNYLMSYNGTHNLRPDVLINNCFITPQNTYNEHAVERTYAALNSLAPINYVNISFEHIGGDWLDCYIVITPNKTKTFTIEGEGTFSGGDWGVAAITGYTHRNLFRGAEVLSVQMRTAYEWRDTIGNTLELGTDVKLTFPQLLIPFIKNEDRRLLNSNTELNASYQYQNRPAEYSRTIAGVGLKYLWAPRHISLSHGLDLFGMNYVRLTGMSDDFKNYVENNGAVLRYQYEDHLIMKMGYNSSHSTYNRNRPMKNHRTIRYGVETAGNLLYGIYKWTHATPDQDGVYQLFDVPFSQYAKADFDLVYHQIFNETNRIVYHTAIGAGYPYGNAQSLPFEKRYYGGGTNSVRGWTMRTLGPGNYQRTSNRFDFNNQTGDIKIDLSMEYRAKLFWLLEGAVFVDVGNIWTIKDYPNQPGGVFALDHFYKQLAASYGLGWRFDFSFFILRFDLAMKIHDPGRDTADRWRFSNITWRDDFAFHFAIGYPF